MSENTIPIPARLKNVAQGGHVAGAEDIIDDTLNKEQHTINSEVTSSLSDVDQRLSVVEQLAEISVSGGDIGIATASDFETRTPAGDAKVPTVAAVADGPIAAINEKLQGYARVDGNYPTLGAGVADNLSGRTLVTGAFLERTTGDDAELANGLAQLNEVQGGSVKFNQIAKVYIGSVVSGITRTKVSDSVIHLSGTASQNITQLTIANCAFVSGHKTFISIAGNIPEGVTLFNYSGNSRRIIVDFGVAQINIDNGTVLDTDIYVNIIDLTAIFGAGNEPSTVAEFESWLAENVGLKDYYEYTDGEVVNNNMTGIESTGSNLLDPQTGKARIIGAYSEVYGNYYGITGTHGALTFEDDLGNVSTITPDSDGKFELEVPGTLTVASAGADCAVFLWWDGKKTEYEDYDVEIAHLDVRHIYGKKNGTGELVQVWPTGMPRINDIVDKLCIENGAVVAKRNVGEVDMGSLTYQVFSSTSTPDIVKSSEITGKRKTPVYYQASVLNCGMYSTVEVGYRDSPVRADKTIWEYADYLYEVGIRDSSFEGKSDQQIKSAMSGVLLYFELETPETYTDLVYMGSEYFADGTPVALPVNYKVNNWGVESILPKNTSTILTAKPTITCKYSIDAVEQLNTHSDEIESLHDDIDELDAKKPNKAGDYPNMSVGAAETLKGNTISSAEYTFRKTGGSPVASGLAQIEKMKGKSLVWNQLMKDHTKTSLFHVTYSNGEYICDTIEQGTSIYGSILTMNSPTDVIKQGDKLLLSLYIKSSSDQINKSAILLYFGTEIGVSDFNVNITTSYAKYSNIFTAPAGSYEFQNLQVRWQGWGDAPVDFNYSLKEDIMVINLTKMFGAGNEPATVAEFEALYPMPYYAYNDGSLINNKATAIESVEFNQWDEEWGKGNINLQDGETIDTSLTTNLYSVNKIKVFPDTTYYIKKSQGYNAIRIFLYDINKTFITSVTNQTDATYTIPSGVYYIRFQGAYEGNYNNDICINISDASRNGTYEPYKKNVCELNIPTRTGKLNGEGESVVVFPDGMKSAGSVYDEIKGNKAIKRIGSVDLGTLTWLKQSVNRGANYAFTSEEFDIKAVASSVIGNILCVPYETKNGDTVWAANNGISNWSTLQEVSIYDSSKESLTKEEFKTAMSGVLLYYELAEPLEYTLDEAIPAGYREDGGGTEDVKFASGSINGVFSAEMIYPIDATGVINTLPVNFISKESMEAFLTALGTAMNGTWTMTWNASTGKYGFTFTPNQQGE